MGGLEELAADVEGYDAGLRPLRVKPGRGGQRARKWRHPSLSLSLGNTNATVAGEIRLPFGCEEMEAILPETVGLWRAWFKRVTD